MKAADWSKGMCRLRLPATPEAVRAALCTIRNTLEQCGIAPDDLGTVELVLAEALNNIVEHAYSGTDDGVIDVVLEMGAGALHCALRDNGWPMPGGTPPQRPLPLPANCRADVAEGGFGWPLVRLLTSDLAFDRRADTNCLDFSIRLCGADFRN